MSAHHIDRVGEDGPLITPVDVAPLPVRGQKRVPIMSEAVKSFKPARTLDTERDNGEGVALATSRLIYGAEDCTYEDDDGNEKPSPVVGFLMGIEEFKPGGGRAFKGAIIRLTERCLGRNAKKEVVEAQPGEEIIVPLNLKLESLKDYAQDDSVVVEIGIFPEEKVKNAGTGHDMWTFLTKAYRIAPRSTVSLDFVREGLLRAKEGGGALTSKNGAGQLPA